jgi:hypothetical protein
VAGAFIGSWLILGGRDGCGSGQCHNRGGDPLAANRSDGARWRARTVVAQMMAPVRTLSRMGRPLSSPLNLPERPTCPGVVVCDLSLPSDPIG